MPYVIKIIAGVLSTVGFAIIFRLKPSRLPFAALDGLIACVSYFALTELIGGDFWPNAIAAFLTAFGAEIFARICKAPATIFLFPGCIALVPGGTLYYSMTNLLSKNYYDAAQYLLTTVVVGIAIGAGIILASLLRIVVFKILFKIKSAK